MRGSEPDSVLAGKLSDGLVFSAVEGGVVAERESLFVLKGRERGGR